MRHFHLRMGKKLTWCRLRDGIQVIVILTLSFADNRKNSHIEKRNINIKIDTSEDFLFPSQGKKKKKPTKKPTTSSKQTFRQIFTRTIPTKCLYIMYFPIPQLFSCC